MIEYYVYVVFDIDDFGNILNVKLIVFIIWNIYFGLF